MEVDSYRLWQQWQQMHYPRRGILASAVSIDLVALDGKAGVVLESYFCRGPQAKTLDAESLATLERCQHELHLVNSSMSSDASRYFGRLQQLIELLLSPDRVGQTQRHGVPAATREPAP